MGCIGPGRGEWGADVHFGFTECGEAVCELPLEGDDKGLMGAGGEVVKQARSGSQCCVALVDVQAKTEMGGAGGEDAG